MLPDDKGLLWVPTGRPRWSETGTCTMLEAAEVRTCRRITELHTPTCSGKASAAPCPPQVPRRILTGCPFIHLGTQEVSAKGRAKEQKGWSNG